MLVCVALSGQNVLLPWKHGALPQADLPRPVGPNHYGLTPQAGSTPQNPPFLSRALHLSLNPVFHASSLRV